jgi:microcystin-dependent protein
MLNGTLPNYGFLIEGSGTAENYATSRFSDVSRSPRLDVEWVADGVQLAPPTDVHSNGPELYWQHYSGGLGPYAAAVLAASPQDYWRLDDAPGQPFGVADWAGTLHAGASSSGLVYQVSGATADGDQAMNFDGVSSNVGATGPAVSDSFSVEAWFKQTQSGARNYTLVSHGPCYSGPTGGFDVYVTSDGKVALDQAEVSRIAQTTGVNVSDGQWHHTVVTKAGSSIHLYVDGVDRTDTTSIANSTLSNCYGAVVIGDEPYHNGQWTAKDFFAGSIDDVAIWMTPLSAAQVQAHYAAASLHITAYDRYEIHRSTTPGFTPSAATLIATIKDSAIQSYRDTTAKPATTFYYKVVTYTNGGANSYNSNELVVTTPAAGQAQVTLQPGLGAGSAKATSLSSSSSCANQGAATTVPVDASDRGLLQFDLRRIPSGATVSAATLKLFTFSTPAATIEAHRLTADWTEGSAAAASCNGTGASWSERNPSVSWQTAGGDYDATAVTASDPGGNPHWDSWNLTSMVQGWINGGNANLGILLKHANEAGAPSVAYLSNEYATSLALRPQLVVTYTDNSAANGPSVGVNVQGVNALAGVTPQVKGTVTLNAGASDDSHVASVQFKLDGSSNIGTALTAPPYQVSWDTTTQTWGTTHTITAVATDDAGNSTTSQPFTVAIANSSAPQTAVSAISSGIAGGQADVPVGAVLPFAGATIPSGWLEADGSAVSRSSYADLFTAEGTDFGAGDGSTTFNLPDLRGRIPLGQAVSGTGSALGASGGSLNMGGGQINLPQLALNFTTPAVSFSAGAISAFTPSFSFPGLADHYNYWGQDAEPHGASVGAGGGQSGGWTSFTMPAQTTSSNTITPTATLSTATAPYRVLRYIVKATSAAATPACAVFASARSSLPAGASSADGSPASGALAACLDSSFAGNSPDLRGRFPIGKTATGTLATLNAGGGSRDFTHTASRSVPAATVTVPNYSTNLTVPGGSYPVSYSWWNYGGGNGSDVWTLTCAGYGGGGSNQASNPANPSPNNACLPANATTAAVSTPNASGGGAGPYSTQTVNDQATSGAYNPAFNALGYYTGATASTPGTVIPYAGAQIPGGWIAADAPACPRPPTPPCTPRSATPSAAARLANSSCPTCAAASRSPRRALAPAQRSAPPAANSTSPPRPTCPPSPQPLPGRRAPSASPFPHGRPAST